MIKLNMIKFNWIIIVLNMIEYINGYIYLIKYNLEKNYYSKIIFRFTEYL